MAALASPSVLFKGSCACGRMAYECTERPTGNQACHCKTCQKLSGGPYQAWADMMDKAVTFLDSKEHLRYEGLPKDNFGGLVYLRFSHVGDRAFCLSCYTPLAMRYYNVPAVIYLAMGSIDGGSISDAGVKEALKLQKHIFTSQKAGWFDIGNDSLPTHERFPGDFETDLDQNGLED